MLTGEATAHWMLGDADQALAQARAAVHRAAAADDTRVRAAAHVAMALTVSLGGDPATVEEEYALAAGFAAEAGEYGDTAAWLTPTGSQLSLNLTTQPLPITTDVAAVTGVDPGPGGSVMVRTNAGPLLWTREARLVRPSQPLLRTDKMAASANALWVDGSGVSPQFLAVDVSGECWFSTDPS